MAPLLFGLGTQLIKQFAPKLIGAVAGDKGEKITQEFLDMAQHATGKVTPERALDELKISAVSREKMQILVNEHQKNAGELYLQDKVSARARDLEMLRLGHINKRADVMLVGAYIILASIIGAFAYFPDLGDTVQGILAMLAGGMLKSITDAFQFEFGSSRGSKEKQIQQAFLQ